MKWDNDDGADKEKVEELLEEGDSRKIGKMDLVTRWKDLYEEERHDLEMVKQNRYTQLGKHTEEKEQKWKETEEEKKRHIKHLALCIFPLSIRKCIYCLLMCKHCNLYVWLSYECLVTDYLLRQNCMLHRWNIKYKYLHPCS